MPKLLMDKKKISIQVLVLPETKAALIEKAIEDKRTLSEYVNVVLEMYVEQNKKQA